MNKIKKSAIISVAFASMTPVATMAGIAVPQLGNPIPQLGDVLPQLGAELPQLGAELSLPILTGIAIISLVAGIRYIRNKRS